MTRTRKSKQMDTKTPLLFRFVRSNLAYILTVSGVGMIYVMLIRGVPEQNRDLLNIVFGLFLGKFNDVYGYYFGSSKDKSDADQAARTPNTETTTTTINKTEEIK